MMKQIILLFICILVPVSASADDLEPTIVVASLYFGGIVTSSSLVVGGVGLGITTTATAKSKASPKQVRAFLKHNGTRLRSELALGSGEVVADFAKLLIIPPKEISNFRKKLRNNRKYISSFCAAKNVTEKRTLELIAWIDNIHPT